MGIRIAKEEDIDSIVLLAGEFYQTMASLQEKFLKERRKPTGEEATVEFYRWALNSADAVIFVAVRNGKLLGYVYALIERSLNDLITLPRVSVSELTIHPEYHRRNIGKRLMDRVEEWAQEKEISVLHLDVWELNAGAIAFYQKLGYHTILRKMEKVLT